MFHPAPPPLAFPGDIAFPDCLPSLCRMLAAHTGGTLLISDLRKNKLPLQPSPLLACCSPTPSICSAQSLCCSLFSCQLGSSSLLLLSTPPREKGEESALIAWRTEHKFMSEPTLGCLSSSQGSWWERKGGPDHSSPDCKPASQQSHWTRPKPQVSGSGQL